MPKAAATLGPGGAPLELDAVRMMGMNPSHALQHPGHYYYMAARCTEARRERFLASEVCPLQSHSGAAHVYRNLAGYLSEPELCTGVCQREEGRPFNADTRGTLPIFASETWYKLLFFFFLVVYKIIRTVQTIQLHYESRSSDTLDCLSHCPHLL